MITANMALHRIQKLYPDLVVVSGLEFPKLYAFYMTPKGKELTTDDGWYCLDKKGKELAFNPLSDPDALDHASPIKI